MNFKLQVSTLNLGQGNAIACDRQVGPAECKSNQDQDRNNRREG
jgi:hypothetical protein